MEKKEEEKFTWKGKIMGYDAEFKYIKQNSFPFEKVLPETLRIPACEAHTRFRKFNAFIVGTDLWMKFIAKRASKLYEKDGFVKFFNLNRKHTYDKEVLNGIKNDVDLIIFLHDIMLKDIRIPKIIRVKRRKRRVNRFIKKLKGLAKRLEDKTIILNLKKREKKRGPIEEVLYGKCRFTSK